VRTEEEESNDEDVQGGDGGGAVKLLAVDNSGMDKAGEVRFCQVRSPPSCSPVGDRGVRFQVTGAGARGRDTRSNSVGAGSERAPRWARRCPERLVLPLA